MPSRFLHSWPDYQELETLLCGSYNGGKSEDVEFNMESEEKTEEHPPQNLDYPTTGVIPGVTASRNGSSQNDGRISEDDRYLSLIERELAAENAPEVRSERRENSESANADSAQLGNAAVFIADDATAVATTAVTAPISEANGGPPMIPVPNAMAVFEDEYPVYDAVPVSSTLGPKERSLMLKMGRCVNCGITTHKVSGIFMKKHKPLTNENVLR